eukprot:946668-Pleurochrysis_carterae.AAC.1
MRVGGGGSDRRLARRLPKGRGLRPAGVSARTGAASTGNGRRESRHCARDSRARRRRARREMGGEGRANG